MAKTEKLLQRIAELERETGIRRTLFAACPNSTAVIKAAFRAAKRNNAPIYFAATLNQIDCDGGYTGMRPDEFVKLVRMESISWPSTTAVRGSKTSSAPRSGRPRPRWTG